MRGVSSGENSTWKGANNMPCYTVALNEVDLGAMGTGPKLKAALEGIGAQVAVDTTGRVIGFMLGFKSHTVDQTGRITAGASQAVLDDLKKQIRVSYSAEIVKAQAKRNGWQVKKIANNRYQVIKGR